MDPDMVPSGSTGQDPPWLQVTSLATHIRLSLSTLESLHYAHILLFLFLPFLHCSLAPLSTIYPIITPKAQRKLTMLKEQGMSHQVTPLDEVL